MSRFSLALAAAAAVFAWVASSALAAGTGCKPAPPCVSAVCIYQDQTPSSGVCTKKTKPVHHHPTSPATTPVQPVIVHPTVPVTPKVTKKPRHRIHRHRKPARKVAPKRTKHHRVHITPMAANVAPPSAVGAAFDLGSGPTALFAALLAAAALLAIGGGLVRGRRS